MIRIATTYANDLKINHQIRKNFRSIVIDRQQPLRFRKAGRVWCGGARDTHCVTSHI